MMITTIFFDLDDTLYDHSNGLWDAIRDRMNEYMNEILGLPPDQVAILRRSYYESYGTTLRGLQIHHRVQAEEFLAYVHDLPLENYLRPDPELRNLLSSLSQPKYIFTNADSAHATRVLQMLNISPYFHGIIDVRYMNYHCKPEVEAYRFALRMAGMNNAQECLMIDDSARNLVMANKLGFTTVLVGVDGTISAADYNVKSLKELPSILPQLWDDSRVTG